jgi:hypothetical protein
MGLYKMRGNQLNIAETDFLCCKFKEKYVF